MPKNLKLKNVPKRKTYRGDKGHLPTFNLDDTQLPAISDWKTGEEYYLVVKVKQVGSDLLEEGNHEGGIMNRFAVTEVQDYTEEAKKK